MEIKFKEKNCENVKINEYNDNDTYIIHIYQSTTIMNVAFTKIK